LAPTIPLLANLLALRVLLAPTILLLVARPLRLVSRVLLAPIIPLLANLLANRV